MGVIIRDAYENDLSDILTITNDAILDTTAVWSLSPITLQSRQTWYADRKSKGFPIIVADNDGKVVGFASFGDFRPWEGYIHTVEHSLYVAQDRRHQGIGRSLLQELIQRAIGLQKHVMIGGIEANNIASIELHKSMGFEQVGRLREVGRKFDRWLDLVFMQRLLNTSSR